MMLWILFALMTAAAAIAILVPMTRAARVDDTTVAADEAVYKAQLEEVDRDLARGLVDEEAAAAARTEIARRLLAARRSAGAGIAASGWSWPVRVGQAVAVVGLPAGALALYLVLGSPDYPDQPLAARLAEPTEGQRVETLVARVEQHLASNPEDGKGWEVLGPVYMRLGRPQEAARAYANAIRLLGSTEQRESDYGEALVIVNRGIVNADARAAFERAVALAPDAVKPRYFLALALGQEGKRAQAVAAWQALLAGAAGNEPWVVSAREELAALGGEAPALRGPSAEDVEAAQDMPEADRREMILGMVQGLKDRLESQGGSVDEWLRLIQAYAVLGLTDEAKAAAGKASAAYQADEAALGRIRSQIKEIGLDS
ncbi:c-type cytochrome biogenesis protein CcmI [Polymorphum gilvum]|uniref:Cytochrome C-type biogenesis transmembrane protein n=1 Tax=Polymorphum gilvum (strain LMG 25793 / CGMCC 1.9160 / SL003B-26A1) TaxID=991905 RepID=F2J6F8_POLGS|nr:c-type cytochrome biogenesis protein CcmI [Polymorphum gilvum]ADZ71332.1 Cytochrome C-type biogenesis transmembrane protein [Polymorphum gilvum SL003B-26A1]